MWVGQQTIKRGCKKQGQICLSKAKQSVPNIEGASNERLIHILLSRCGNSPGDMTTTICPHRGLDRFSGISNKFSKTFGDSFERPRMPCKGLTPDKIPVFWSLINITLSPRYICPYLMIAILPVTFTPNCLSLSKSSTRP